MKKNKYFQISGTISVAMLSVFAVMAMVDSFVNLSDYSSFYIYFLVIQGLVLGCIWVKSTPRWISVVLAAFLLTLIAKSVILELMDYIALERDFDEHMLLFWLLFAIEAFALFEISDDSNSEQLHIEEESENAIKETTEETKAGIDQD